MDGVFVLQVMEDDMDMDMEDEGPIKVVKNYKRQVSWQGVPAGVA